MSAGGLTPDLAKRVSKGVASAAVWQAGKVLASALAAPILARLLTPAGYGQYAYYLAIVMIAWPIANAGMLQVLSRFVALHPENARWRRDVARVAGPASFLATCLVGGAVAVWLWTTAQTDAAQVMALLVALAIGFEQLGHFGRGVLYGAHRDEQANLPAALGVIAGNIISVVLAWLGYGIAGALAGLAVANMGVGVVSLALAWPYLRTRPDDAAVTPPSAGALVRFGLASALFLTLSLALYRADAVLIRSLAGDAQAGVYAAATQWSEFVWFLPLAVQSVMMQSTARLWADGRTEDITALVSRLTRYVALGTALLLTVIVLLAEPIMSVYFGPAYAAASLPLRVLAPGVFGYALARVIHPVIQARGNATALLPLIGGAAALNIVLNLLLLPRFGAVGAAVASCVTYGGLVFAYDRQLRRYGVRAFAGLRLLRLLLLCAVAAAIAAPALLLPPLLAIVVGGALASAVFVAGALWLGLLSADELKQAVERLPAPPRRWLQRLINRGARGAIAGS